MIYCDILIFLFFYIFLHENNVMGTHEKCLAEVLLITHTISCCFFFFVFVFSGVGVLAEREMRRLFTQKPFLSDSMVYFV